MKIIIPGRPITKKNSQRIALNRRTGEHHIIQSEQYVIYEEASLWELRLYRGKKYDGPIQVTAHYWMPNKRSWPDLMGVLQATCDILQKAGIITNDRNVVSLDGSPIVGVDRGNPRTEIIIQEMR